MSQTINELKMTPKEKLVAASVGSALAGGAAGAYGKHRYDKHIVDKAVEPYKDAGKKALEKGEETIKNIKDFGSKLLGKTKKVAEET